METLKRWFYRLSVLAIDVAQSIVAGFGGGNGDPTRLHEAKKPPKS
jgi:hypothetical protein